MSYWIVVATVLGDKNDNAANFRLIKVITFQHHLHHRYHHQHLRHHKPFEL